MFRLKDVFGINMILVEPYHREAHHKGNYLIENVIGKGKGSTRGTWTESVIQSGKDKGYVNA